MRVPFAPWPLALLCIGSLACGIPVDLGGAARDGAAETSGTCSSFAAPETTAPCSGCKQGSSGCQPNGCFNGYACDVSEHDCKAPGTPCSTTGKFDSQ